MALYAVPATPVGSAAVVMASGAGAIITVNVLVALCGVGVPESATVTFTVLVPAAVGVPVICPVLGLMLSPAGNPVADQLYGCMPPSADTAALYAVPTVPLGSVAVVMESSAGAMTTVNVLLVVCGVGAPESVTVTVTEFVPGVVGVPVICPVLVLMLSPAGNPAADHV